MYTEESLKEELIKKLGKEQMKYIDIVKEKGINYAIDNAYKITARQAIIDYFSNSNISYLLSFQSLPEVISFETSRNNHTTCNKFITIKHTT